MPTDQSKLTQHEIRKIAVQYLFSMEQSPGQKDSVLLDFILDGRELSDQNKAYFESLTQGVMDQQDLLDQKLAEFLMESWSIDRLTVVDRCVARLGAYEILFSDLPSRIAIDEAINLAKDFSDEAASRLINGLLTQLIKKDEE